MESDNFRFADVEWKYAESHDVGSRHQLPPVRVGVNAVSVTCKQCGAAWQARQYGRGRLYPAFGSVKVTCPSCGAGESVKTATFQPDA